MKGEREERKKVKERQRWSGEIEREKEEECDGKRRIAGEAGAKKDSNYTVKK